MPLANPQQLKSGFCIFIDTVCDGPVPSVFGRQAPVVYATEEDAQREIADNHINRLQEFLDGQRDFEDAVTVEEYVVPVCVQPNGDITDSDCLHTLWRAAAELDG
jgi:hypothetical protein